MAIRITIFSSYSSLLQRFAVLVLAFVAATFSLGCSTVFEENLNNLRGDDASILAVADNSRDETFNHVTITKVDGHRTRLLINALWSEHPEAVVVPPGEHVVEVDWFNKGHTQHFVALYESQPGRRYVVRGRPFKNEEGDQRVGLSIEDSGTNTIVAWGKEQGE